MSLSRVSNPPKPVLIEIRLESGNIEYDFKWNQPYLTSVAIHKCCYKAVSYVSNKKLSDRYKKMQCYKKVVLYSVLYCTLEIFFRSICLALKVFNSINLSWFSWNSQVSFLEKPRLKIISFEHHKHGYQIHNWLDKALKDTIVNLYMEGHLKIRLQSL